MTKLYTFVIIWVSREWIAFKISEYKYYINKCNNILLQEKMM